MPRIVVDGVTYIIADGVAVPVAAAAPVASPIAAAPVTARAEAPVSLATMVQSTRKSASTDDNPFSRVECIAAGTTLGCEKRFLPHGIGRYEHSACPTGIAVGKKIRQRPEADRDALRAAIIATGEDVEKLAALLK